MTSTFFRVQRLAFGTLIVLCTAFVFLVWNATRPAETLPTLEQLPTPRPDDLAADKITLHAYPSLSYGIQAFLWWDGSVRGGDLEYLRLMRFAYVKQIFGWKDIQPISADQFDWSIADGVMAEAEYRGVKMIARLSLPPDWALRTPTSADEPPFDADAFGHFCGALAARYKGRISGYQVWNEPNLAREWHDNPPNATAYVRLLSACNNAIKAADPAGIVISAGLAPTGTGLPLAIPDEDYLWQLYAAGMAGYYDVLGVHAPGYKSPPETSPDDPGLNGSRWQAFRHVEDIRAIMVANGEAHKQIAILELGWTTDSRETITDAKGEQVVNPYRWHAVTEAEQAKYLVDAYAYAGQHWRPWVGLIITIYIGDRSWTPDKEEYWWSIIEPNYYPRVKQALIDLANMARYINDTEYEPPQDPAAQWYQPLPPRQ
ncbi:MAG: hypothetical protein KF726_00730 [Anaerolineae bacterium]|nr:hypothetical protein [Anaerolineae bacterium]